MYTPRPTVDTDLPVAHEKLQSIRRRQMKERMPVLTPKERRRMSYILAKFRTKQMALLGEETYSSDPDPFHPTYVFYCFQGEREY